MALVYLLPAVLDLHSVSGDTRRGAHRCCARGGERHEQDLGQGIGGYLGHATCAEAPADPRGAALQLVMCIQVGRCALRTPKPTPAVPKSALPQMQSEGFTTQFVCESPRLWKVHRFMKASSIGPWLTGSACSATHVRASPRCQNSEAARLDRTPMMARPSNSGYSGTCTRYGTRNLGRKYSSTSKWRRFTFRLC